MEEKPKEFIKLGIWILFIILMSTFIPILALYWGRGAESLEYFQKTTFYQSGGLLLAFSALYLMRVLNLKFGYAFVHSHKEGWLYNKQTGKMLEGMGWIKSPLKFIFIGVIIFSLMGIVGTMTNTFFVGIPTIEQQISQPAHIALAVEPASSVEVMYEVVFLFALLSVVLWIRKKYDYGKIFVILMSLFVVAPIRAIFAVLIHYMRYAHLEMNLIGIFLTRYIHSIITLATGSILWEWIWHSSNNFFFKLSTMFSNDIILITTGLLLGSFIVIGMIVWVWKNNKKEA